MRAMTQAAGGKSIIALGQMPERGPLARVHSNWASGLKLQSKCLARTFQRLVLPVLPRSTEATKL
jgi:hypothetical protein